MATSITLSNLLSVLPNPQPRKLSSPPPFLSLSSTPRTQKPRNASVVALAQSSDDFFSGSPASLPTELSSVICPSAAFANTMFFNSGYNVQVIVDDNESEERLLNRFRREVFRAGVIQESKRRRFFENKQEEKKRKTREAAKRNRKRRPQARFTPQNKQDAPATKKDKEDDDNWDMPEDAPF